MNNKRLNYQFISDEKKVAIVILSPPKGIKCICKNCNEQWKTAKYAVLVVIKTKVYPDNLYSYAKDKPAKPSRARWVHSFELIGPDEASRDYCKKTESCEHMNEYSTPVFSSRQKAEKYRNAILASTEFQKNGDTDHGTLRVTWDKTFPKYENGVLEVIG